MHPKYVDHPDRKKVRIVCLRPPLREPSSQPWFHGKINRRAAEVVISKNGNGDGLFLLRDSTFSVGDYVLSMSSANQAYHFQACAKRAPRFASRIADPGVVWRLLLH